MSPAEIMLWISVVREAAKLVKELMGDTEYEEDVVKATVVDVAMAMGPKGNMDEIKKIGVEKIMDSFLSLGTLR
jgi:hypothetical protein